MFLDSISCLGRGEIRRYIRKNEASLPMSTARSRDVSFAG